MTKRIGTPSTERTETEQQYNDSDDNLAPRDREQKVNLLKKNNSSRSYSLSNCLEPLNYSFWNYF